MYFKIENNEIVNSEYENPGEEGWIYKNFDDSVPLLVVDGDIVIDEDSMPPRPTEEDLAEYRIAHLRTERNRMLAESDWMANSDVTMSTEWSTYRQALRDITNTYTSRDDVVWPTKPE